MKILNIVTGVSGAGKSLALRTFEDLGYEVIDNPPLDLINNILDFSKDFKITIGLDIRSRGFSSEVFSLKMAELKANSGMETNIIFVDCLDSVIRKRYTETRRKHPLTDNLQLTEALAKEREMLVKAKEDADLIVDTTDITGHAFKRILENKFAPIGGQKLSLVSMSFSFKKGVPAEADLVFDVRFLRNPHYDEGLKLKTGLDKEVRDYIKVDKDYDKFWNGLTNLLEIMVPRYVEEGKSYLTIAFGCTGGRHRSVTFAHETKCFLENKNYKVDEVHREIEKELRKI